MTFPVLSANGPSGYNLTRSLRFRASATAYLSRTPATATNRTTWTWSGWVKRGQLSATNNIVLFSADNGTNQTFIRFRDTDILQFGRYNGTTYDFDLRTTAVYRDPSAFYHILAVYNSGNATSSSRVLLYINGVQVTAFGTATYPTLSFQADVNSTYTHGVGALVSSATKGYCDGYMAEVNFVDGQALTPSSFGSTNSTTGVWQPAKYTGTYGTNGFYLPFTNTTSTTTLGYDSSGNGNNWTTNNISLTSGVTYDSMTDVPTLTSATAANYAVLNPLDKGAYVSQTNGNLTNTGNTATNSALVLGSIGNLTSGKWYWEYTQGTVQSETCGITTTYTAGTSLIDGENIGAYGIGARASGAVYGGTVGTITSWTTGDVIGISVDCDNGAIYWSKNGTVLNSGVPTSGASKTGAVGVWTPSAAKVTPAFGAYNNGFVNANFGQQGFTYTPPSGFVALNTYNLPASTVPNGASYMAATLYTGTGASLTVANTVGSASFQPDLVWIKSRSAATDHKWTDSVRGVTKGLISNTTGAETTDTTGLTAFGSTGFTVGANTTYNNSGATYVAWNWKAGGTAVSNTSGSITSSVSANTTSGFSVVTYTGTGANATVGHGLGVAPSMMIFKVRSTTNDWAVYHSALATPATQALFLNLTNAVATTTTAWNSTAPTSSVFSIGNSSPVNVSATTFVAYCFAAIKGFSAFGSYTGNGSTDGPFIYTGFRPRWVLVKSSSAVGNWQLLDTSRSTYNVSNANLYPNLANAEVNGGNEDMDILSNGFKPRNASASFNVSGTTYIYACFAENPFQNALAR